MLADFESDKVKFLRLYRLYAENIEKFTDDEVRELHDVFEMGRELYELPRLLVSANEYIQARAERDDPRPGKEFQNDVRAKIESFIYPTMPVNAWGNTMDFDGYYTTQSDPNGSKFFIKVPKEKPYTIVKKGKYTFLVEKAGKSPTYYKATEATSGSLVVTGKENMEELSNELDEFINGTHRYLVKNNETFDQAINREITRVTKHNRDIAKSDPFTTLSGYDDDKTRFEAILDLYISNASKFTASEINELNEVFELGKELFGSERELPKGKNPTYTNHYAFHKAITEKKTLLPIDHFLFYKSAAKEQKAGEDADYDHIDYPQQFSLEWIKKVNKSLINNRLSINDFKKAFAFVQQKKPQIQVMLSSYSKDALLSLLGSTTAYRYKSEKKDRVIDAVYDSIEKTFQLGTITFTFGENIHDAIAKKVEKTTQSDLAKYAEEVQKEIAEYKQYIEKSKKSLSNPETIEEFEYFLSRKPKSELTKEQLRRYDELLSSKILERREIEFTKKAEIKKVENVSEMKLIETVHTKYNYPLYVVQLQGRVEKDTYNELNSSAKKLGGWYSSFRGNGAIPGFQFKDKAQAEKFMALREGDITNIERKEEIKTEKTEARADKLRATAESMIAKADQELGKERLTNTYRRANMANNADSKALNQKRLAQTMLNIADVIDNGKAKYLNYISTTTQIELLESIVRDATRREHNEKYKDAYERRKHENDTATIETADYIGIGYYPSIYVETIRELIRTIGNKSGGKLLAQRWTRKLQDYSREQRYQVKSDEEMSELKRMVELLSPSELKYSRIHEIILQFARLKAMKIDNDSMLREVVREFIMYRAGKSEQSKVTMLERSLAGKSNVGIDYFPTPKELAERMVEMADIEPGMSVLEPSAGNGNIADAIKNAGVNPDVIELSSTLREILEAKGYPLVGTDFMEFDSKKYDRIIMNPPFSDSQDAQHIKHAYSLLKPGGRIVSIAGEGIFFRKDKKSIDFQEFLDEKNAVVEKLPEKTFTDKKLYSTTGANARLLVLDKPKERKNNSLSDNMKKQEFEEKAIRKSIDEDKRKYCAHFQYGSGIALSEREREDLDANIQWNRARLGLLPYKIPCKEDDIPKTVKSLLNDQQITLSGYDDDKTRFEAILDLYISNASKFTASEINELNEVFELGKELFGSERELPVFEEKTDIPVLTEEDYLAINGASRQDFGDSALHKNKGNNSDKQWSKLVDAQAEKDRKLMEKRQELREEFQEKVENGELREPTRLERLVSTANAPYDTEARRAARAVLAKNGMQSKVLNPDQNEPIPHNIESENEDEITENYMKINSDQKLELHFSFERFKELSETQKKYLKSNFLWSKNKKAWISKAKHPIQIKSFSEYFNRELGLVMQGKDKRKTFAEELEKKESSAKYRVERYGAKAESAESRGDRLQREFRKMSGDWSWITQPIIRGHSGSEAFGRQRAKVIHSFEQGFKEFNKAKYYEEKQKLAEDVLNKKDLRNIFFVQNRIKDAEKSIKEYTKYIENAQSKLGKTSEDDNLILDRIDGYIENLSYNYDKLAYYKLAEESLLEDSEELRAAMAKKDQDKAEIKDEVSTVKSELRKYFKKIDPKIKISHSGKYIAATIKFYDGKIPNDIRLSIAELYGGQLYTHNKDNVDDSGNIRPHSVHMPAAQWKLWMISQGIISDKSISPESALTMARELKLYGKTSGLSGLEESTPTYPTIPQSVADEIGQAFTRAGQMDFVRLMKNPAVANTVIQLLKQHGIINSGNQSAWMIDSTTLTDNGITILRESLWKTIFPNLGTSDFPVQVSDKVLKNLSSFLKIRQNLRIFQQFEIAVQIGNEFAGNDDTVMFDDPLDAQEFAFLCPFLYDTKNDKFEWVLKKYLDWNGKTDRKQFLESLSGEIGHKKQRQSTFGLSDQYVWR